LRFITYWNACFKACDWFTRFDTRLPVSMRQHS